MGIRDRPIARRSPWQNGFAERLIGSIRRECLDHVIVVGETHLRRTLRSYCRYYNKIRTHRSLDKDAPLRRPVQERRHYQISRDPGRTPPSVRSRLGFSVHTGAATRREIIEPRNRGGLVTEQIEVTIRTYFEVTEVGAGFGQCLVGKPDCESNEPVVPLTVRQQLCS